MSLASNILLLGGFKNAQVVYSITRTFKNSHYTVVEVGIIITLILCI